MAFILTGGTVGYWLLEDWSWIDALYMTVITITYRKYQGIRSSAHCVV